jgi:transposase
MRKKRRRMTVHKIREICRLHINCNISLKAISRACNISSSTAHTYITKLKESNITYDEILKMSEDELRQFFTPAKKLNKSDKKADIDYEYIYNELKRKGVTIQLLHEEYLEKNPNGYGRSQFYELYRRWKKNLKPAMRQLHKYGDKMYVDFSGTKPYYVNPETGEIIETEFFVSVLGGTSYTFACAVPDQTIKSFIECNIKSFEYFGGCPNCIVPDNLKAGVTRADYYDPEINKTFADMAEHYNVAVLPTRVAKPKDKAKVENAVLNTQRRILAAIRDRTFFSLEELNNAISIELEKFNKRPMQFTNKSRYELFIEYEQKELSSLPSKRFEIFNWRKEKVTLDYHIKADKSFYSVPYTLIGKDVDIRHNSRIVEVFFKARRVALHLKSKIEGSCTTDKSHMCHEHRHYLEWTPEKIKEQAQLIGPQTTQFIDNIFESHKSIDNAFRGGLGIIRLCKKYSPKRLEAACKLALDAGAYSYRNVKNILNNGMDTIADETDRNEVQTSEHSNIRGTIYYKEIENDTEYH